MCGETPFYLLLRDLICFSYNKIAFLTVYLNECALTTTYLLSLKQMGSFSLFGVIVGFWGRIPIILSLCSNIVLTI